MRISPVLTVCGLITIGTFVALGVSHAQKPAPVRSVSVVATPVPTAKPTPTPSPTPVPTPVPTPKPTPVPTPVPTPRGPALGHILMYHYVRTVDPKKDLLGYNLSVTAALFDEQIGALKSAGYQFETISELMGGKTGSQEVAVTFDDGYEDFYTDAWPTLKKYEATATSYIITNKIGGPYMTWDQIREIKAAGIEIGAHTMTHPDLSKLSIDLQRQQIVGSKAALESQLGGPVTAFCYPSGKYTADTINLVRDAGFTSATTTKSGNIYSLSKPYELTRIRVTQSMNGADLVNALK